MYADNKVDVIIYAVEKSLDSYKFNLLHNKQMFISQLKSGAMGARTIDEGTLDEKSGMNFSEYMAILSGNTDLLDKAKLEKRAVAMESEKKAFNKDKYNSVYKLQSINKSLESNNNTIAKMGSDWAQFNKQVQIDSDGTKLNPIRLNGVDGNDIKILGNKLAEINDKSRTAGEYKPIGELYGFTIIVKTESTTKDLFELSTNKFMVEGNSDGTDGIRIKYNYNNGNIATDSKLACLNFLNALERIPKLIEQYKATVNKLEQDIPVLEGVIASVWSKEEELKELKGELATLERKITLSLKPIEQNVGESEKVIQDANEQDSVGNSVSNIDVNSDTNSQNYPLENIPIRSISDNMLVVRMKM